MFTTFYHQLFRKYVTIFGTLFNNIYINRSNDTNDAVQTLKVPIAYAPKDKVLARLVADPALDRPVAITLPRMSFEMQTPMYDSSRKMITVNRIVQSDSANTNNRTSVYTAAPYNIIFQLYIYVKNTEDGTKIVEQILPYFTPDFTLSAELLPDVPFKTDIPIVLQNVTMQDTYEGNFEERRVLVWQLDFVMKAHFFGPIKRNAIIKFANIEFYDLSTNTVLENVTVQPGLTANGEPTTNASATISYLEIDESDDYGYITIIS